MAVAAPFGRRSRDAARGLALRHDHGSAFMAEDLQRQLKAWGVKPSYAFVRQPETNGLVSPAAAREQWITAHLQQAA